MNISREESTYMKALAIIFIILSYILNNCIGEKAVKISALLGTGGVWIFLILSGYGLFCSYKEKGLEFKLYWNSKVNNVFGPYVIITIIYYLWLRLSGKNIGLTVLVKNILCIDYDRNMDGTMWYMSFLLLWYILFFVVFYFDYSTIFKVTVLFVCAYIFYNGYYKSIFSECNWQFVTNAYAFPIGVLLGSWSKHNYQKCKDLNLCKRLLGCGAMMIYLLGFFDILSFSYGQFGFILFGITFFLGKVFIKKMNIINNIVTIIGKNSYILYLVEGKVMSILAIQFLPNSPYVFAIGMIMLTWFVTYVYNVTKKSRVWRIISES